MRTSYVQFVLGALSGILLACIWLFFSRSSMDETGAPSTAMVEAIIDSLDTLQRGEIDASQMMLASEVNAETQAVLKRRKSSPLELAKARDWRVRMQPHNKRLGLKEPEE